jgi:hypothetical protein
MNRCGEGRENLQRAEGIHERSELRQNVFVVSEALPVFCMEKRLD